MADEDFYDYGGGYDDDDRERRWPKILAALLAVLALAGGVVWYVSSSDNAGRTAIPAITTSPTTATSANGSTATSGSIGATPGITSGSTPTGSSSPGATESGDATSTSRDIAVAQEPPVPPDSSLTGFSGTTTTDSVSVVEGGSVPDTPPTLPSVALGTPYPTELDGTPRPIVAIFDTSTITLTGQVPSQAAADRLALLALANSQTPATVVNNLTINPSVPLGVGVRVIEMQSVRFPERSSTVLPAHAAELDRVAKVMNALPNVTVLVVGHADQRGTAAGNFMISDARARAVVNYLVYVGIAGARLSSRAAGDSDLLAAGSDAASLALNRRTEFIFYGLLTP